MFAVAADFFSMIIIQKITIKYVATTKAFYKVMRFFTLGKNWCSKWCYNQDSRVEILMFMLVRHILCLCYSIRALSVEDYSTVERKG